MYSEKKGRTKKHDRAKKKQRSCNFNRITQQVSATQTPSAGCKPRGICRNALYRRTFASYYFRAKKFGGRWQHCESFENWSKCQRALVPGCFHFISSIGLARRMPDGAKVDKMKINFDCRWHHRVTITFSIGKLEISNRLKKNV